MSRADQYNVTVVIGTREVGKTGTWDKFSGGEIDSEESKYRPGNMGDEISLGGYVSVSNIMVSRLFDHLRHTGDLQDYLIEQAGKADVTVTKQPLDVDEMPFGKALVYTGKLKRVAWPEHDSMSADPSLIEIEISSAKLVSA